MSQPLLHSPMQASMELSFVDMQRSTPEHGFLSRNLIEGCFMDIICNQAIVPKEGPTEDDLEFTCNAALA
jgi:hypothetical protein